MQASRTISLTRLSLLGSLVSHARLSLRLLREPSVPSLLKALPIAAVVYVLSPLDVVPDVLPLLGQIDDLGIILLALTGFVKWSPVAAVEYHQAALASRRGYSPMPAAGEIIDAEFRREDDRP